MYNVCPAFDSCYHGVYVRPAFDSNHKPKHDKAREKEFALAAAAAAAKKESDEAEAKKAAAEATHAAAATAATAATVKAATANALAKSHMSSMMSAEAKIMSVERKMKVSQRPFTCRHKVEVVLTVVLPVVLPVVLDVYSTRNWRTRWSRRWRMRLVPARM
jgi:hypothetical protein